MDRSSASAAGGGRANQRHTATKFIFRGGFKIPRELTPMSSVDSFGGATVAALTSAGTAVGSATKLKDGGGTAPAFGSSCHNPTRQHDTNHTKSGGVGFGSTAMLRDRDGDGRHPDGMPGLEGIMSSSKIRVGMGGRNEKGGGSNGGDRRKGDDGKRLRPRTAGATVGRRDPVFPAGDSRGGEGRLRYRKIFISR